MDPPLHHCTSYLSRNVCYHFNIILILQNVLLRARMVDRHMETAGVNVREVSLDPTAAVSEH